MAATHRTTASADSSSGRTTYRSNAARAAFSSSAPSIVVPSIAGRSPAAGGAEVITFYPHRSLVPRHLWFDLVVGARERVEFLTYAGLFFGEDNPEAIQLLRHKAANGVKVRIALGDPDSPEVALRGREEGMEEGVIGRVRMSLAYFRSLIDAPDVDFHLHRTTLYNSFYRFDDQMMINQHAYGTHGFMAPILHLRKVDPGDLFPMYEKSFELAWARSYPCPAPD